MIAIPNMEKPKNCYACSFNGGIFCDLIDNDTDAFIKDNPTEVATKVLPNCPLIKIDDEAFDIAEDIIDGCRELKERINADIVRCGECKWCDDKGKGRALICTNPYIDMDIHPLDFCSYGKRRDDEKHR